MDLNSRKLLAKIQALPPTLQQEVINFVNFLEQSSEPPVSINEETFFDVEFQEKEGLVLHIENMHVGR